MGGHGENDLSARIAVLPAVVPGPDLRARVLEAMADAASSRTGGAPSLGGPSGPALRATLRPQYAAAAGIVALVLVTALLGAVLRSTGSEQDGLLVADGGVGEVVPLIEASWVLERALDELPAPRAVMRADTASTIAALETRIASIDEQLVAGTDRSLDPVLEQALWRDRVQTMSALYQVRFGQAQRLIF